ncbi:hypothetical protein SAMN05216297_102147 [Flavobacterium phragmitis]|uniref:Uncharacterized protein n=1 Tax=Flavobacterium phragmitis TaxID=739143 RepID=A0A1I1M0J4_9FLAO|nr:hypothetical protein SAMN05216297_102147 [Flavobacterium phragmitis]
MISGSVFTVAGLLFPANFLLIFKINGVHYLCNNLHLGIILTLVAILFTFLYDLSLKNK